MKIRQDFTNLYQVQVLNFYMREFWKMLRDMCDFDNYPLNCRLF